MAIKKNTDLTFADKAFTIVLAGPPGVGKALKNGTGVLTREGFKRIEMLKVGDYVYGEDGQEHKVVGVYPQGVRPVYRMTFSDGQQIECDEEHIWRVHATNGNSRRRGWHDMTTKEMLERGVLRKDVTRAGRVPTAKFKTPIVSPVEFPEKNLEVSPYIMGVLLGDGCISEGKPIFSNPLCDKEIADRVVSELPEGYSVTSRMLSTMTYYIKHDGRDNKVAQAIKEYGVCEKAGNKHIPSQYLFGSVSQRLDLLRGLMDTDGSALFNRVRFSTTSHMLAEGVVWLVKSLGGLSWMSAYDRTNEGKPVEYSVNVKLNICPFYLKRKADQWRESVFTRRIMDISKVDDAECTCIMVDNPTGLFVTDGFVVTHNTTLALSAPKPLLIDFDKGVARVRAEHRQLTAEEDSYDEFLADLESDEYKECETIILDTGGSLVQLMQPWARANDQKAARDGRAMFGVIKSEFLRLTAQLRGDGKNVVIIFHTAEVQKGDTVMTRLSCEGSVKDIVWTPADLGGTISIRGKKRIINFSPTEESFGKGCYGIRGEIEIPELAAGVPNKFLSDLFDKARANIAKEQAEFGSMKLVYDETLAQGASIIAAIKDAESATAAVAKLGNLKHALTSKAELSGKLQAKVRELGLKWDKTVSAYVAA